MPLRPQPTYSFLQNGQKARVKPFSPEFPRKQLSSNDLPAKKFVNFTSRRAVSLNQREDPVPAAARAFSFVCNNLAINLIESIFCLHVLR
jgi:hypothetical protein